jgi:cyanamide hydratase
MSFEFYGGMLALDLLGKEGAPKAQAESVAEAVMRHQDLGDTGTLSSIGALIQLATIFGEFDCALMAMYSVGFWGGDYPAGP